MQIDWLIANVTAAGSPDRAECAILRMFLDIFWTFQATFVAGESLVGIPY